MLHTIRPKHKNKERKRVGRGGKRGTYSGKGMKGQKSRSGSSKRPAERDYIIRLPKRRGFKNKPLSSKATVVHLYDVERAFEDGEAVTVSELILRNVVRPRKGEKVPGPIKLLGDGEVTKKFIVRGVLISASAREKIIKAGGSVS